MNIEFYNNNYILLASDEVLIVGILKQDFKSHYRILVKV